MAQCSPARHIPLDHSTAGRKEWPVDRATKALPGGPPPGLPPWVNAIASALPSPFTSPIAQNSPARHICADHSVAGRKPVAPVAAADSPGTAMISAAAPPTAAAIASNGLFSRSCRRVTGIMPRLIPALNRRLNLILNSLLSGSFPGITDGAPSDSGTSQLGNTSPFARCPVHEAPAP